MQTAEFLRKILPSQGVYYVCLMRQGRYGMAHKPFHDVEAMAEFITEINERDPEKIIYHANASFKHEFIQGGLQEKDKKYYRVVANRNFARAFWLDIDTGPDRIYDDKGARKGYATKKEGLAALLEFCKAVQLPVPMLVDSGNGLHCYWVMDRDLVPSEWIETAAMLAACLAHLSIYVDTSATEDFVRILRPVGTMNRKPNKPEREVVLKRDAAPMSFELFHDILQEFISQNDVHIIPKDTYDNDLNSDLTAHAGPHIPSWGADIADKCGQLDEMRSTEGDVSYEHWRAVGGLLKHCEDGTEVAIQWTAKRHLNHSKTDIEHEMQTWNAGPTRCSHFQKHNPSGCAKCPHAGKITSPIVLGYRELQTEEVEEVTVKDGEEIVTVVPELPRGYSFTNNLMCKSIEVEDRIEVVPFSSTLFYARTRVKKEDGKYAVSIRSHMPREGVKDFEIDQSAVASQTDLLKVMAGNQIHTTHHKSAGTYMTAYLKDWLDKLKHTTDEQRTYQHFGWHENNTHFLIGDRMYCPDGEVKEVLLGQMAKFKLSVFPPPKGDLQAWTHAISSMYNKPNEQHRQYAIASSFGCALTQFVSVQVYRGLLFAITGGKTSKGKTTLSYAALSVWGNPEKMYFGSEQGATTNARYANMGVYHNIPMLFDEFTHITADEFSKLCYTVSSGEEKHRLVSGKGSGVGFAETFSWRFSPFITANKDLHSLLSTRGGSSEAEAVRMIQIHIDEHEMAAEDQIQFNRYANIAEENAGVAGDAFIRYVVANRQEVERMMIKWMRRINDDVPEAKYRFYRGHAECSMAALEICVKLGILSFDVEAVYEYVVRLFTRLAHDVEEQNSMTNEDAISSMISALSPGIAVTDFYRDLRTGPPDDVRIHGRWNGRVIRGAKGNKEPLEGRLYLSARAVKDWCAANRITYREIIQEAKALGLWVELTSPKFVLGRGTSHTSGQEPCICLNYFKLESMYGGSILQDATPSRSSTRSSEDVEHQSTGA